MPMQVPIPLISLPASLNVLRVLEACQFFLNILVLFAGLVKNLPQTRLK